MARVGPHVLHRPQARSVDYLGRTIYTPYAALSVLAISPGPGEMYHWAMSVSSDGDYVIYMNLGFDSQYVASEGCESQVVSPNHMVMSTQER